MAIQVICDACGHPIETIANNSPVPEFHGQVISSATATIGRHTHYQVELHHSCADRLLKAMGRERMAIKAEGFVGK
jgi:hypothetical protein